MKIINETGKNLGYVMFEFGKERLLYLLDADDVLVVHNLKVCTPDEYSRLNGTGSDLQPSAEGQVGGN